MDPKKRYRWGVVRMRNAAGKLIWHRWCRCTVLSWLYIPGSSWDFSSCLFKSNIKYRVFSVFANIIMYWEWEFPFFSDFTIWALGTLGYWVLLQFWIFCQKFLAGGKLFKIYSTVFKIIGLTAILYSLVDVKNHRKQSYDNSHACLLG